jgi:hypothetical protein
MHLRLPVLIHSKNPTNPSFFIFFCSHHYNKSLIMKNCATCQEKVYPFEKIETNEVIGQAAAIFVILNRVF